MAHSVEHSDTHAHAHDAHDSHHHKTKHYSDTERLLYKHPKHTWDECTDSTIELHNCMRDRSRGRFPIGYIWTLLWADRWQCHHENQNRIDCENKRIERIYDQHRDEIAARR
jgi:hypothetical protein